MSERLNQELTALETALAVLSPAEAQLDRDRLMVIAGEQSAMRRTKLVQRYWLMSNAVLVLVSIGLAGLLMARAEPRVVERIVYRDRETTDALAGSTQEADASSTDDRKNRFQPTDVPSRYFRLRQIVLTKGVVGIPESAPRSDSEGPQSLTVSGSREMLKELLGT